MRFQPGSSRKQPRPAHVGRRPAATPLMTPDLAIGALPPAKALAVIDQRDIDQRYPAGARRHVASTTRIRAEDGSCRERRPEGTRRRSLEIFDPAPRLAIALVRRPAEPCQMTAVGRHVDAAEEDVRPGDPDNSGAAPEDPMPPDLLHPPGPSPPELRYRRGGYPPIASPSEQGHDHLAVARRQFAEAPVAAVSAGPAASPRERASDDRTNENPCPFVLAAVGTCSCARARRKSMRANRLPVWSAFDEALLTHQAHPAACALLAHASATPRGSPRTPGSRRPYEPPTPRPAWRNKTPAAREGRQSCAPRPSTC